MARTINKKTLVTLKAAFAAFGVYFCMYGFRKPFTVASFEGLSYFGVDYKILIIIAQAIGYFISKFIGIKFISELEPKKELLIYSLSLRWLNLPCWVLQRFLLLTISC